MRPSPIGVVEQVNLREVESADSMSVPPADVYHPLAERRGGVGHNLPQEAAQEFAQAVIDVDGY
jgi:hypothetical protein